MGPSSSPATADKYLHARSRPGLPTPTAGPRRGKPAFANRNSDAPTGLEGRCLYLGVTARDTLQHRYPRLLSVRHRRRTGFVIPELLAAVSAELFMAHAPTPTHNPRTRQRPPPGLSGMAVARFERDGTPLVMLAAAVIGAIILVLSLILLLVLRADRP